MTDSLTDPRAYLQKRVSLFSGVMFVFFGVLLAFDLLSTAEGEPLLSSTRVAHLVVLATSGVVRLTTRWGVRPGWVCRALELGAVTAAMAALAPLPAFPPVPGVGGVMAIFAPVLMAVVVLLRAAVVPSPVWLSVAVALVWGGVMTAASVVGWEGLILELPGQPSIDTAVLPVVYGIFATAAFTAIAGVISRIVFGLEAKVREAIELGQYTLEAKIGEGGMGAVYRARHRMLRRPTAVKLLPREKAGERAIARFEREVQQTSRLTHPNTVAIYDYGRTQDGVFYYAMEYLDGITLEDLVAMIGPLPPERTIHVLVQVADALSEAHALGLVHRDVKPDNIMLCERGGVPDVVKVLDFGLVKDIETPTDLRLSSADSIQGSPLYMAPEALTAPTTVDARADLYSLGGVAYYLLSGTPVFRGSVVEVFGHHLHTAPEPLSQHDDGIDPGLERLVLRCLAKDPGERPESAAALAVALQQCPRADAWTRARAAAWWDAERAAIAARRRSVEPSTMTIAPA